MDDKRRTSLFPQWRTSRFFRWFWYTKLTSQGRYVFPVCLLAVMLSGASLAVPVFQIAALISAFFLIDLVMGWLLRPRVRIEGRFPRKAVAGQPVHGSYILHNQRWLPLFQAGLGFFKLDRALRESPEQEYAPLLRSRQSAKVIVQLEPLRRGIYGLPPLRPYSVFPFNLIRSTGKAVGKRETLLVLPHFHPIEGVDVPLGSRYQPGGIALTSHIGESPEYIGNREYRPGDAVRHIDHRAWGRLAKPVVREYMEEYYCRIALVMDTYVQAGKKLPPHGFENMEAAISISASIADAISRGEYIIDIFAAGPELYVFRTGRHTAHLDNVLEILACVEPCRENPFEEIAPALSRELGNISAMICVLLDWDRSRLKLAQSAIEAGCSVKIIVVSDHMDESALAEAQALADSVVLLSPDAIRKGGLGVI
ncbi:MAG: DUF58 domain-containing protein [Candidatus Sumerlaeia bacterium]